MPDKIMIVEDTITSRRIIRDILNRSLENIVLLEAVDGSTALPLVNENPDLKLIITDWNMPFMNGIDFSAKVREVNKDVKILMVTVESGADNVMRALKAGINDFIMKPYRANCLVEKVNKLMGRSTEEQE